MSKQTQYLISLILSLFYKLIFTISFVWLGMEVAAHYQINTLLGAGFGLSCSMFLGEITDTLEALRRQFDDEGQK